MAFSSYLATMEDKDGEYVRGVPSRIKVEKPCQSKCRIGIRTHDPLGGSKWLDQFANDSREVKSHKLKGFGIVVDPFVGS